MHPMITVVMLVVILVVVVIMSKSILRFAVEALKLVLDRERESAVPTEVFRRAARRNTSAFRARTGRDNSG